jgi:hypothetical protein
MKYRISAINHDGRHPASMSFIFEDIVGNLNMKQAIRDAAYEFAHTELGLELLDYYGGGFSWGDVADIPEEICEKHGFRLEDFFVADATTDYYEALVTKEDL